ERDPDRRVRAPGRGAARAEPGRGGGAGGPHAPAADPDDQLCVHPRLGAAGDRDRCRRRAAPGARHRGVLRHARCDRLRPRVHADVLRRQPQPRPADRRAARPVAAGPPRSPVDPSRIGASMTLRAFAFSSLSALALAGCAVGPDYVATPPRPASSGPFLAAGARPVAPDPLPAAWWRLSDAPVPDGLVADALAATTDVRQAVARIERARAGLRGAQAGRLPQTAVGASGGYGRQSEGQVPPGADREGWSYDAGIEVGYELDLFGRVSRSVEAARGDLAASEADADAVRVIVVAETTRAYADAASGAAQLRVAREIVELLDQSLALTSRRHDAGLESGLAVAQIAALREQRAAEIPALEAQRQAALFRLATLTGRAPAEL